MLARQVRSKILTSVNDRDDFDRRRHRAIEDSVGCLNQLAHIRRGGLRDASAGFWKVLSLAQAEDDALNYLFRVDWGRETNVFRDGPELVDCLLRPAEHKAHEARRIRPRTRAIASS